MARPATMKKRTTLWRIEGGGDLGDSYLFGTMHVRDSRMFEGLELIFEKIRCCTAFAAEFHLDEAPASDLGLQLSPGQGLRDLLPPRKYAKLRQVLKKSVHIDLDHYQALPPFFIVNLISERILVSDMPVPLDLYLWDYAKAQNKALCGVETIAEQMKVLSKISLSDQVDMLLETGRNISRHRKHLLHMADLYQKRDLQRLYKTVKKNAKGMRKLILYRRNEIMADRIASLVAGQPTFAAVGAAHLGGGKGVIRLLKKKGLKVRPVQITAPSEQNQDQA